MAVAEFSRSVREHMIESCYWKDDLLAFARRLRRNDKPKRWTEKQAVVFEKDLMTVFFWVRKLQESHKLSSKSRNHRVMLFKAPRTKKQMTLVNLHDVHELYNFEKERKEKRSISFVANQFIHFHTVYPYQSEKGPWGGVIVCSDFEKDKGIYRITVDEITTLLEIVGTDYPSQLYMTYEKNGEIVVQTN